VLQPEGVVGAYSESQRETGLGAHLASGQQAERGELMKLFQIIANAQGARAIANMAQAFGLGEELTAQTVRYFIPAISKAIENRAKTPEGLVSVLEFLGSRRFDRFLDDPRIFGHAQVLQEGERALEYLFVRKDRINRVIEKRAEVLPIDSAGLRIMFPFIAVMAVGAIAVRTRRPLSVIWHRISNGAVDDRAIANPYLALAEYLKKQEREQKDQRKRRLFSIFGAGSAAASAAPAAEPELAMPEVLQSA
jgi:hypothetical protein